MTQKQLKDKSTVLDYARQIWLAGLGAFSKAETEGSKLFEALVKEGEQVEAQTKKMALEKVEGVRGRVEDTWDGLEQAFEDRVARVLNRLGVPTHDDVQELSKRVEDLHESVKALTKEKTVS